MNSRTREGYLYGLVAYGWWGLVPLYFRLLTRHLGALDILAHRIVWSMLFLGAVLTAAGKWRRVRDILHPPANEEGERAATPSPFLALAATTVLIAINWLCYILAVVKEQVVQASLGYFMTPLVSVLLGMIFFHERLRRLQWVALALAIVGVIWLTVVGKEWPWISFSLALSFGFYGLLRKRIPVDGLTGLSVETLFLLPVALGYLFIAWWLEPAAGWFFDPVFALVVLLSGVVTAVPLLCFGQAAQRLPLSTLGFLQYLAPSIQFVLAVMVLGEDFDRDRFFAFFFIWVALALFSFDSYRMFRPPSRGRNRDGTGE